MKFLLWSVGVLQILIGLMFAWSIAPGWRWVWITCALFWFFAGAITGLVSLAKLVSGKGGAGVLGRRAGSASPAPAPVKFGSEEE